MAVDKKPFEADFGFKSPGFTVDNEGNVIVRSLSYLTDGEVNITENFTVSNAGTAYVWADANGAPITGQNPQITLERGETYIFKLSLSATLSFSLLNTAGDALYNTGVSHTSLEGFETTGSAAQGNRDGFFKFVVPINAPDVLKYGDLTAGVIGQFDIIFPTITGIGQFSELVVTGSSSLGPTEIISTEDSIDLNSGALKIAGGAAIDKNLNVGGIITANSLRTNGTGIPVFETETNLEFNVGNEIVFIIDNELVGKINNSGTSLKIVNTTIENTIIGGVTPAAASFTTGTVSNIPSNNNDITNKSYVDLTSTAFAIALGT